MSWQQHAVAPRTMSERTAVRPVWEAPPASKVAPALADWLALAAAQATVAQAASPGWAGSLVGVGALSPIRTRVRSAPLQFGRSPEGASAEIDRGTDVSVKFDSHREPDWAKRAAPRAQS